MTKHELDLIALKQLVSKTLRSYQAAQKPSKKTPNGKGTGKIFNAPKSQKKAKV